MRSSKTDKNVREPQLLLLELILVLAQLTLEEYLKLGNMLSVSGRFLCRKNVLIRKHSNTFSRQSHISYSRARDILNKNQSNRLRILKMYDLHTHRAGGVLPVLP